MTRDDYRNMIETLYQLYDKVEGMDEESASRYMISESKAEGLQMITDAIRSYRILGYNE